MPRTDSALPGILIAENNSVGHITFGSATGLPSLLATAASKFAPGCILIDSTTSKVYRNAGTSAVPSWKPVQNYTSIAADTNGTSSVSVFGAVAPVAGTISAIYVISKDTTAGNITIADTAGTVAVIAKGTVSGVMVGAASLANATFAAGDALTIVSSSAGNATVVILFA